MRDLIDQQLLLEKGKDLGITADTEVIKRLDEMRKEMKLESMEDLEKAAVSQGISFEDFKQNLKNQIITQQVISKEVGSRMSISKEELQQFYDDHKSQMERPEQIRLSELLVSTEKKGQERLRPTTAELAAAQAKAEDLLAQIRKGASFDEIAKKNSDGPTAAQGGDLGYFKRGTLAKELEDKTFAMKPGDVSDVIRTKQGFVILEVAEHQAAGVPPLQRDRAQGAGRDLHAEAPARVARLFAETARRRLHQDRRRLCGHRRQSQSDGNRLKLPPRMPAPKNLRKRRKSWALSS